MRISRPKHLGALILATTLIPPLTAQFKFGTSIGVTVVAFLSILSVLIDGRVKIISSPAVRQVSKWIGLIFAYILCVGIISLMLHPAFDLNRFILSLFLAIVSLSGAYCFALFFIDCTEEQIQKSIRFVFILLLFSGLARVFGIHLSGGVSSQTILFYNEPSHFALGLAPYLLFMVASDTKRRWIWMALAVAFSFAIQSLTLIMVTLLILAVVIRPTISNILFVLLLVAVALGLGEGLSYFTDRAALSSDNTNLSNLVYLSGLERAWLSIDETLGIGYGFNQLGIVGTQGEIMLVLDRLNADGLNLLDGGSVAPKLIAELGTVGILLLIIYIKFFLKYVQCVHFEVFKALSLSRIDLFFCSVFLTYSIDLFVRGSGFFTAESFMFLGSIWGLALRTNNRKPNISADGIIPISVTKLHPNSCTI